MVRESVCLSAAMFCGLGGATERPNIIFMLADDLGYGDLTCYNPETQGELPYATKISTPCLDRMAANGMRMTQFYSTAPICSPSRRSLLTARYPNRLGEWAEGYRSCPEGLVAAKDPTIGMWLRQAGYATAVYGKWNVGETPESDPSAHGFDDYLIIDHNTGYFEHLNNNSDCQGREMLFAPGRTRVTNLKGKYLTDIFVDKGLEFIDANKDRPFFLYLPFSVPHSPLQDPEKPDLKYDEEPDRRSPEGRAMFVKMVEYLDSHIAEIFVKLEEHGLLDNTLVIFTSDNGGMAAANNWPLKKSKQWLEEGGVRVPCLMQWPGKIPAGTVNDTPLIMMDASVAVLAVADALQYVPEGRTLDGINLLGSVEPSRVFGWRRRDWKDHPRHPVNYLRQEAFRSEDWKLIRTYKHLGDQTWSAEYKDELFNIREDIGEENNLAQQMPEKYEAMKNAFAQWKSEVVNLDSDYLIPVRDQTGSPANLPEDDLSMLFDFEDGGLNGGRFVSKNNEEHVSGPEIESGLFKVRLSPGIVHPVPMIYRVGDVDTSRYSCMRIRMKATVDDGSPCNPAKALLRFDTWNGEDVSFAVTSDGQWHEYRIDVTESSAWSEWTSEGRIGLVFPDPAGSSVSIEVDDIQLEE